MNGQKDGTELFMNGELKIKGDMTLAMKLGSLKDQRKKPTTPSTETPTVSLSVQGFKSSVVFEKIQEELKKNPQLGKEIDGVIEFNLSANGKSQSWTVNLKQNPNVSLGKPQKSDCTLIMKDEDCFSIMTGGQDATELFMSGGLKIKGDMSFAMKLGSLKVGVSQSKTNGQSLTVAGFKCSQIFSEIAAGLKESPEIIKEFNSIYEFVLKRDSTIQSWSVDLKKGNVYLGKPTEKADCTLIMSDEDCFNIMSGNLDATELFMSGGLKIKGDMTLAMKLGTLKEKRKSVSSSSTPSVHVDGFKSSQVFTEISKNIKPELVKSIDAVYEFSITNENKKQQTWIIDCKKGLVSTEKPKEKSDVTLIMSDENCFNIMSGAQDATEIFMNGGLKIKGDMSLAMKLGSLKDSIPKSKL